MNYHFASDNTAGACPEVMQALIEANEGYMSSYGTDDYTTRAADLIREVFETDCDVYFVFNGTAANSLALATMCQSYHSVVAHEYAHIVVDECGAPEFFSNGSKILLAPGEHGKFDAQKVNQLIGSRADMHFPKPRVLSITQLTEAGTTYKLNEINKLCEISKEHGLRIHMDGARFANAIASLNVAPKDMTWKAGVDVLCFGGTKNGMPIGDAVVFFDKKLSEEFAYRCKQAGQLASKMRFLAAPWVAMLKDGAWLKHARNANACAASLSQQLAQLPGCKILHATEGNEVFAEMPAQLAKHLRDAGWAFYDFIGGGARFVCSWKTTQQDVDALIKSAGQYHG
jgi:threonine aldolase